jgi:hypothetical protein
MQAAQAIVRLFCACYLGTHSLIFCGCIKFVQSEKAACIFVGVYCAINFIVLDLIGA